VAEPSRGMGRGLAALLTPSTTQGGPGDRDLRQLPVELISPNPRQPRRGFDEEALLHLAASLGDRGVLQPVLVRLLVEELGLTREEIGRRVGRSRVAVSNLLRLLDLPDEALEMLVRGDLTEGHGRAILMAGNHDDRRRLARAALAEGWNVRRTEAEARAASEASPADTPVRVRRGAPHPDQEAAASRLGEAFGRALGADVKVTPRGTGYKVALTFESLDEALELASRIGTVEPV
jgi:ParB-like chromosome segregation protein Spo0J